MNEPKTTTTEDHLSVWDLSELKTRRRMNQLTFKRDELRLLEWLLERSFCAQACAAYFATYRDLAEALEISKGHAHGALQHLLAGRVVLWLGEVWPGWVQFNTLFQEWNESDGFFPPRQRPAKWYESQPALSWPPALRHALVESFVENQRLNQPARVPDVATAQAGPACIDRECAASETGPRMYPPSIDEPTKAVNAADTPAWVLGLERLKAELDGKAVPESGTSVPENAVPKKGTSVPDTSAFPKQERSTPAPALRETVAVPKSGTFISDDLILKRSDQISKSVPAMGLALSPAQAAMNWLRTVDRSAELRSKRYEAAWSALCQKDPRYVRERLFPALERGEAFALKESRGEKGLDRPLCYLKAVAERDKMLVTPAGMGRRSR